MSFFKFNNNIVLIKDNLL